jgi:hypothetical protein
MPEMAMWAHKMGGLIRVKSVFEQLLLGTLLLPCSLCQSLIFQGGLVRVLQWLLGAALLQPALPKDCPIVHTGSGIDSSDQAKGSHLLNHSD